VLVNFLLHAGLPWLALRQAPRSNDHDIADVSWLYFLPHFDIAGKKNYKQMCALTTQIQLRMTPEVKAHYNGVRTLSWAGNNGCNMFWDQIQETANNLIKPHMCEVDDNNLGECVTRLNGIKEVESRMAGIFGDEPGDITASSTRVEIDDISAVVAKLKEALGGTFAAFCATRASPFRAAEPEGRTRSGDVPDTQGPTQPWKHVNAVRISKELNKYLNDNLVNAPEILQD